MYTDPSDQSVWQYHRWLVEQDPSVEVLNREIQAIQELLEVEPDSKCEYQRVLSSPLKLTMDSHAFLRVHAKHRPLPLNETDSAIGRNRDKRVRRGDWALAQALTGGSRSQAPIRR